MRTPTHPMICPLIDRGFHRAKNSKSTRKRQQLTLLGVAAPLQRATTHTRDARMRNVGYARVTSPHPAFRVFSCLGNINYGIIITEPR